MTVITKASAWIPVTDEALADAPPTQTYIEYMFLDPKPPLTWPERVSGLREFTGRNGVTVTVRVGWRADLSDVLREFAREAWPEDYADDDDD